MNYAKRFPVLAFFNRQTIGRRKRSGSNAKSSSMIEKIEVACKKRYGRQIKNNTGLCRKVQNRAGIQKNPLSGQQNMPEGRVNNFVGNLALPINSIDTGTASCHGCIKCTLIV